MERYKLNVISEPKEEKTKDDDSRKKTKLANPKNRKFGMDKVNYTHKVFVSCVKRII